MTDVKGYTYMIQDTPYQALVKCEAMFLPTTLFYHPLAKKGKEGYEGTFTLSRYPLPKRGKDTDAQKRDSQSFDAFMELQIGGPGKKAEGVQRKRWNRVQERFK